MANSNEDSSEPRNYRIQVSDFGPIAHADVEFRPLTVFLGPSNTGKSYLATLSYAAHRHFMAAPDARWWSFLGRGRGTADRAMDLSPEGVKEFRSWVEAITKDQGLSRLPKSLVGMVRLEIENAQRVANPLRREIVRSFGSEGTKELVRRSSRGTARIVLSPDASANQASLSYTVRISGGEADVKGEVHGSLDLRADDLWSIGPSLWLRRFQRAIHGDVPSGNPGGAGDLRVGIELARQILGWLVESKTQQLVAPMARMAYYLPADRTGIMHSHKMVVSALVQAAASAGLRRTPDVAKLSGVLTDFLQELIQMGDRSGSGRLNAIRSGVASEFERNILGGTVRIDSSETNYPQFFYRPGGWKDDLVLMRSSSMVSELAPLILYLRHVVQAGDVLIVEEPESHLHPAMQVEVINLVAKIVKQGVRVIVTTHSEWVLNGLANIVQTSRIDGPDTGGGSGALALSEDEVGAWRFIPQEPGNGVIVEEIRVDSDGLYPSGFDDVAMDLHNQWAGLQSRVAESA